MRYEPLGAHIMSLFVCFYLATLSLSLSLFVQSVSCFTCTWLVSLFLWAKRFLFYLVSFSLFCTKRFLFYLVSRSCFPQSVSCFIWCVSLFLCKKTFPVLSGESLSFFAKSVSCFIWWVSLFAQSASCFIWWVSLSFFAQSVSLFKT